MTCLIEAVNPARKCELVHSHPLVHFSDKERNVPQFLAFLVVLSVYQPGLIGTVLLDGE